MLQRQKIAIPMTGGSKGTTVLTMMMMMIGTTIAIGEIIFMEINGDARGNHSTLISEQIITSPMENFQTTTMLFSPFVPGDRGMWRLHPSSAPD
jgi:hypothetical protein